MNKRRWHHSQLRPITDIADELGISAEALEPYGKYVAKVPLNAFPENPKRARVVVVTAITPTPFGEGKSTTAIGLTDGMAHINKKACLTIRQPSLGPVFGHKGGGTGGGCAMIEPATKINLHFTGDFHAIESAHNLLAAMTDNAAYRKSIPHLEPYGISWRRVTDAEDRGLRNITAGLGKGNGPLREAGFDISAASEIMAIVALADGYKAVREMLSNIVVGWTREREPVTAADMKAVGAMMALLKDAVEPNLVQTREGNPAFVHMGPFGNIAHGCSSIIADMLAVRCSDYIITEAGFGAELGFEKFMDIKVRRGSPKPDAAVVVATIRGLKWHGGVPIKDMDIPNEAAVRKGSANLKHAIGITESFGVPAVVAVNRFPSDTDLEIAAVKEEAISAGARDCIEARGFTEGGAGMADLAHKVVEACEQPSTPKLLYEDDIPVEDKVEIMAKRLYLAAGVEWSSDAKRSARMLNERGWNFPICMAKTHLSISSDPKLRGVPSGHTLHIRELRPLAGARQIVALAGNIITLPGLPSTPNAWDIDVDEHKNRIIGILGSS